MLSDEIAAYILQLLEAEPEGAELRRNELAESLGCVPSQINYVLTSRFTPELGFVVESRRGGGGYIRIRRVAHPSPLMHVVGALGGTLPQAAAMTILESLCAQGALAEDIARLIAAAVSDTALRGVPATGRDEIRASLFKAMLAVMSLE
ncbi:MAG: CtsR family transcriptional regulator [Oscillospiraceae bacterium]|nr:CtsR family transcriptional regulator [Oscillospiraceae bacterium]